MNKAEFLLLFEVLLFLSNFSVGHPLRIANKDRNHIKYALKFSSYNTAKYIFVSFCVYYGKDTTWNPIDALQYYLSPALIEIGVQ